MRAKIAKALRRQARQMTVGMPERQLIWNGPKQQFAINNPDSFRGVYRAMKNFIKKGRPYASQKRS